MGGVGSSTECADEEVVDEGVVKAEVGGRM